MRLVRGFISLLLVMLALGLSGASLAASPGAPSWNSGSVLAADSDGDGISDDMDPDDDNDGISDANEGNPSAPPDNLPIPDDDNDTIPDDLDPDDNNNGATDEEDVVAPGNGGGGNGGNGNGGSGGSEGSSAVGESSSGNGGPLLISALPVTGAGSMEVSATAWLTLLSLSGAALLMTIGATSMWRSPVLAMQPTKHRPN